MDDVITVPATEAKNDFASILEKAIQGRRVVITKHDAPKAVLISIEEYERISPPKLKLDTLRAEWDAMFERMQAPGARAAMDAAFRATPEELGEAAVRAARKRA